MQIKGFKGSSVWSAKSERLSSLELTMTTLLSHITMELAREPEHPYGDRRYGYHFYLPLTQEGRIDVTASRQMRALCRVRRFRPHENERHGRILHGSDGAWRFDYDDGSQVDDEIGFKWSKERFIPGEYVSIREDDGRFHTYQIISVRPA